MNPNRDSTVDVFRGATVALMILVNNPGSWNHLYSPLAHAPWHGWTLTDLVFPFFLFTVGHAMALTLPARSMDDPSVFSRRWAKRFAVIFGIGLLLNAWPFIRWGDAGVEWRDIETVRIMGVLQRIALCWGVAAVIVYLGGLRAALVSSVLLLLGYWAACVLFAQGADPYSLEGFFGTTIDRHVLGDGHLYRGEGVPFDPEGLASTLPAIAQVLLGYTVGISLIQRDDILAKIRFLLIAGVVAIVAAALWQSLVPINKKLWTPSYVLLTTGLAAITLAALLPASTTARRGIAAPLRFFEVFGRNALLIFALSGFVPRTLSLILIDDGVDGSGRPRSIMLLPWLYRDFFEPLFIDPRASSFAFAVATLFFYWMIADFLHRRRWYFKA